jgi:acetylglutamate kinase
VAIPVGTLVTAGPTVPLARSGRTVVKLGGRSLESTGAVAELASELAALGGGVVLVHGGGAEVTAWCARLGLQARFDEGLRVTDGETLDVATAVLAGLTNKRLVAALRHAGIDALGLSALDGGIVEVRPHADRARLGEVGEVAAVNAVRLGRWLDEGLVPVVASIGASEGTLLNLNADDVAAALASAIGAASLVLLSDTRGVRLGGSIATHLDASAIDTALAGRDIEGGMRVKLRAARAAVTSGVPRVHVTTWQGTGTLTALMDSGWEDALAGGERNG